MVSYAFKGGEVVLRLSGDAAKHLAIYLANLLKQGGPSKGKTTLKRMIADGKELSVQRIDAKEIPYFNEMAKKYGVMFVAIRDKQQPDGKCDIMFRTEDSARVQRIFDRLAISEHPDVAHIKAEINRKKEEHARKNRPEPEDGEGNPTKARNGKGERKPPSAPSSQARNSIGSDERPSVRSALKSIRTQRAAEKSSAPVKFPAKSAIPRQKTR